jgi:cytochrome P450
MEEAMTDLTLEIAAKTFSARSWLREPTICERLLQYSLKPRSGKWARSFICLTGCPFARIRAKKWAINYLDSTIRRIIAERRKTGEDREDLLSMLLHAVDSEGSKTRMTDEQARDEAMVLFLAGHDTTAPGLSWFCTSWASIPKYNKGSTDTESV